MPPVKSNEEYLKDFDVDMDEDLKTVVYDMTADKMKALIPNQQMNEEDVPFEGVPTRRVSTHGF